MGVMPNYRAGNVLSRKFALSWKISMRGGVTRWGGKRRLFQQEDSMCKGPVTRESLNSPKGWKRNENRRNRDS